LTLLVLLLSLLCRNRSACFWFRRTLFRWCRCCHMLLRWMLRRCSGRCAWSLCSLGPASGNGVHGLFSLHGHHWDLVTVLPRLVLYSTRIHCLSCGDTSRRYRAAESTDLACAAALMCSLCRLLYSAAVVLSLFESSWDALFSRCVRLKFCILSISRHFES
jgi:hypothetical protein